MKKIRSSVRNAAIEFRPTAMTSSKRILISGASGLVGGALQVALRAAGHEVIVLKRGKPMPDTATWDPDRGQLDLSAAGEIDAVIHLAGDNISSGRWTEKKKTRILASRVQGTSLLAQHFASSTYKPEVFLSASAIGIYGHRDDEVVAESSSLGEGFLADVCQQWEGATASAEQAGIRVVHARIGVILDASGGALSKLLPPFRCGLGGKLGNGKQWMSWISLADVVASMQFLLQQTDIQAAVNLVAPNASTNERLTKTLARVLGRPSFLPLPAFVVRLIFGQMGQELLLSGVRVQPQVLLENGFEFRHPQLEALLSQQVASA
jgi:uncharacterized protein (TIGR01777 family)